MPSGERTSGRRALVTATALWLTAALSLSAHALLPSPAISLVSPGGVTDDRGASAGKKQKQQAAARVGERHRTPTNERRGARARRKAARERIERTQEKVAARNHSLPVPPRSALPHELGAPHHDYPALDVLVRSGTPVRAVTAGRVRDVLRGGACGNGVIVLGRDDRTYTYCHGSRIKARKGERVDAGEHVLASGNTGRSSAPHVHLQVRTRKGRLICPQTLLKTWARPKGQPAAKVPRKRCVR